MAQPDQVRPGVGFAPEGAEAARKDEVTPLQKEAKSLVLSALGASAFIGISAATIRDCDLLSGNGTVKLPLLDIDMGVFFFFLTTPVFLLLLFLYVHMDLRRAVEHVPSDRRVGVWPLSEFPPRPLGGGLTVSLITLVIVWGTWPAVMLLLAWKVLPVGHVWLSPLAVTLCAVSFAITIPNYTAVHERRPLTRYSRTVWIGALLVLAGSLVTWTICSRRVDPRNLRVTFTDFKGADVSGLDLAGRSLQGANFTKATLSHARLANADLTRAVFISSDLEYAGLCGARLEGASFRGARARGTDFRCGQDDPSSLASVDFSDADLRDAELATMQVRAVRRANLVGASFWSSDLVAANLSESDVGRVNFSEIRGRGAWFEGVRGIRPVFYRAQLAGAHFARAQLERPNFTAADLTGADFAEASIVGALLSGTILVEANLRGCNFSGAYLKGTKLTGATYDEFTVPPAGFSFAEHRMVRVD